MPRQKVGKLGEILLATSLITPGELDKAIAMQARTGKRLGQILIEQGSATEDDVAWALSNQLMYPYVFLSHDLIDDEALRLLPEAFLREHHVFPIHRFGQQVTLAMADPTDEHTVNEVATRTGLHVNRAVALESNIEEMLQRLPPQQQKGSRRPARGPEAQYLQFHLTHALQEGASEIHFDPATDGQHRVRYRLQGILVDRAGHPEERHAGLMGHLREFAGLADAPSATATTSVTVGDIEARAVVSVVPATGGPAATIALYPYRTGVPDLLPLGVDAKITQALRGALRRYRGALVIGCADPLVRTMLIRALLPETPRKKVWAIEKLPVYRNPAITQTAIESSAQAAALLGGAFRAGVDLVAVDDVSDASTLRIALECARTRKVIAGHPQGDVAGVVAQVIAATGGALVASTLTGVLAARKVRLLCPECKERLGQPSGAAVVRHTFTPRGCATCGFTGFRGYRVLTVAWVLSPNDRGRLRGGGREAALARLAEAAGSALREQGHALIDDGLTSIEELSRVLEGS
jgi:type II secretory ATPase GspE/PulE/Tfp pilus assembly ATPase PilB-like protein